MFFKDTYSKNSKSPVLQLFESVRTERGPKPRLVVSLGTKFQESLPLGNKNDTFGVIL